MRLNRLSAITLSMGLLLTFAAPAAAENEWCDDGSPPPNDFRVQATGAPSVTSSFNWLRSIDGGGTIYDAWMASGTDLGLLQGTQGGVANGMANAQEGTSKSAASAPK